MVALTVEWAEEKAKSVGTNRGTDGTSDGREAAEPPPLPSSASAKNAPLERATLCGGRKNRAGILLVRFLDVHARATAI
jgi:hypothetical protein